MSLFFICKSMFEYIQYSLWLVRMDPTFISKMHFADLNGQYSTSCRNLDVVEMCAILAALPDNFEADENGKKEGLGEGKNDFSIDNVF